MICILPVVGPFSGTTSSSKVSSVFWLIPSLRVCAGDSFCNRDVSGCVETSGVLAPCPEGTPEDVLRARDIPNEFWLNGCEVVSGTLEDWFMLRPQRGSSEVGPSERGTDALSQDTTGRICSPISDALVRVPESTGLLLLSSGRESTWCKEPNTGIRPVAYQRYTIPISWELIPNPES